MLSAPLNSRFSWGNSKGRGLAFRECCDWTRLSLNWRAHCIVSTTVRPRVSFQQSKWGHLTVCVCVFVRMCSPACNSPLQPSCSWPHGPDVWETTTSTTNNLTVNKLLGGGKEGPLPAGIAQLFLSSLQPLLHLLLPLLNPWQVLTQNPQWALFPIHLLPSLWQHLVRERQT